MGCGAGCDPRALSATVARGRWEATGVCTTPWRSNGFGLCDMSGNVWEWTWDYGQMYADAVTDPSEADTGTERIYRGGSFAYEAAVSAVARRWDLPPEDLDSSVGVRLVRTAPWLDP